MGTFSRHGATLRYTPRRRASTLGSLFELAVCLLILLTFVLLWATIVASPWIILALVLHLLGVF